jgi:hypothetical protein
MATKLLPTTMVGSYPRPSWFRHQLEGRDIRQAFKLMAHAEAFEDAVRVTLRDQEQAGLDVLTDGQMWFDDYGMGIGSFLWYWFERISGFGGEKIDHPALAKAKGTDVQTLLLKGSIAGEVVRVAEEIGADCILLGGWEHKGDFRDILLEASREIANLAPCSVLIVKSRDAEKAYNAL